MKSIDLHIHSTFSDGTMGPTDIIKKAVENNIAALSITDHDTMAATHEAIESSQALGVDYITGVEVSTHLKSLSIHILGYNLDPTSLELIDFLSSIQEARRVRNEKICLRLKRMGIHLSISDIETAHGVASQIGRPHIAQMLVKKRVVSTEQEAFSRYLKKNGAAYVQRKIMPTIQSISVISSLGGIPVLAHPAGLGLSENSLSSLIDELQNSGLRGVETYHPLHSDKMVRFLKNLCAVKKLLMTGGSDFHARSRDKAKLGEYGYNKPIPGTLLNGLKNLCHQ